ncbi:MAG: 1-(5-phosphoribosyl)-5-[(5-phosphoribosylamino)methylideneamino]imidazole-4-carboxamide isomerase [Rhodospirillales bacterium]|nr:1-(5-phosphoribosyl)-5-[(5-phosphoribosylamino)methylideneamino]imidazole-4-carboxamide isomerase [Rhodospirillales bacterium]
MNLYPAIDLKDGNCVRLVRGDMNDSTIFNNNPGSQAKEFADAGCKWIHVVDLNGAFAGEAVNGDAVTSILDAVDVDVQMGGGIRTLENVAYWLDKGLSRVILGTVALRNPDLVKEACKLYPGKVAVGIDAKDGKVAVEGWAEVSEMTALDLALKFEDAGVAAIIYTDISRDGAMQGPNIEATSALAEKISTPVILSGGVSSMDDLVKSKEAASSGIEGVITGRAVYDGHIDVAEALKLLEG